MKDYKSLFALALSIAVNCDVDDPENTAQEAVVALWVHGECENPRGWVAVAVRRAASEEWAGRDREAAKEMKVRYRPRREGLEECQIETEGFEEAVMDRVFLEQVRERWRSPGKRLKEVRAWASG